MISDDSRVKYQTSEFATTDDAEILTRVSPREDMRMFTGDSITEILARYNQAQYDVDDDEQPISYVYNLKSATHGYFDNFEMTKPKIGCFFCHQEITLNTGCYLFCQLYEHYDRNILLVACSDVCPRALKSQSVSNCQKCSRDYIHCRYDKNVCQLCRHN